MLQTASDSLTEVLPSTLPSVLRVFSFVLINKGLLTNLSKFALSHKARYLLLLQRHLTKTHVAN